jgi:hypothetical protein
MRTGHIISLVGAVLALLGALALPWQSFQLAGITAGALDVMPTGGLVVLFTLAALASSALGITTFRRYQFAAAVLGSSLVLFALLVYANMGKGAGLDMMALEHIDMGAGYTVAVWGALLTFVGPLVVFASQPKWTPDMQFLRVAVLWKDSVVEERVLQNPQTVTVGDDIRNAFVIPNDNPNLKRFPLFRAGQKGEYAIGLTRELEGQITVNKKTQPISEFIKSATENVAGVNYVPIAFGDWGIVNLGELRVFFQFIRPDERTRREAKAAPLEFPVWASIGWSSFIQIGFLLLSILLWDKEIIRTLNLAAERDLTVEAEVIKPEEKKIELPEPEAEEEPEDDLAKKAGGEEGKFGDPDERPDKESKIPKMDGKMADKIDVKRVGLTDLLSTNKLGGSGAIADILGKNSSGIGNKIAYAMAGEGGEFVMGHGSGGMGFTGDGSGGGGTGTGRIQGMADIDTGGGKGVRASLGDRSAKRVGNLNIGSSATQGFCKKSNIESVVKRRAGAIRACYEQRLQVKKDLAGKVTIRWTINAEGRVEGATATQNTLSDGETTSCIVRIMARLSFEKPEGGICVVQWPFVFSPG